MCLQNNAEFKKNGKKKLTRKLSQSVVARIKCAALLGGKYTACSTYCMALPSCWKGEYVSENQI